MIVNPSSRYGDAYARGNIKTVRVARQLVPVFVIDGDAVEVEVPTVRNAKDVDRRILDTDIANGRVDEGMGLEEFGLGFPSIAALVIPVIGTTAVQSRSLGAFDCDVCSGDTEQRTFPLLVSKFGDSLESDLRPISQ